MQLNFTVNGRPERLDIEAHETLLDALRNRLHLTGTKDGCREGECGACTVLVDGRPVDACIYAAMACEDSDVETIEGLSNDDQLTALQHAFVTAGGVQCGFCTPGFIMMLTALLRQHPQPSEAQIREAISGNICRCTGYTQIVEAVQRATAKRAPT